MRILLKKMTLKSVIQNGKNKGLLVGEVMKKCKIDLIYTYFNYSNLTFTDDILDMLYIKQEDRIAKPGKDADKFAIYRNRNINSAILEKIKKVEDEEGRKMRFATSKKKLIKSIFKKRYRGI
jgi:hypothetical protein